MTSLQLPSGAIETDAFKINDNGRIVGGFANSGGEEGLLVWRKDELTVLALPNGKPVSLVFCVLAASNWFQSRQVIGSSHLNLNH
jgi:uncharacterized membrane protein